MDSAVATAPFTLGRRVTRSMKSTQALPTTRFAVCDLDSDRDDEIDQPAVRTGKRRKPLPSIPSRGSKRRLEALSAEADKENNCSSTSKRRTKERPKPLAGNESFPSASQESPPAFQFKQRRTALLERKMQKMNRHDSDKDQRIADLVTYFNGLDNQRLSFA